MIMLTLILSAVCAAVIAYVVFVLFWGKSTDDSGTDLSDFITDSPENPDVLENPAVIPDKYHTNYTEPGKQLLVLFGTEYGFSEEVAKSVFDKLSGDQYQEQSWQPRLVNAKDYLQIDFSKEQVVLCVFSTTGDGVPPTDARTFMDNMLSSGEPPSFGHIHYAVLALGDSNYPHYCRTGKNLDARLCELGGKRLYTRVDIDQEDWPSIHSWIDGTLAELGKLELVTALDYLDLSAQSEDTGYSRTKPFVASMTVKYPLTAMEVSSDKETIHAEFDLSSSELSYTAGDALGVYPLNNPPEVDTVVSALRCSGDERIPVPSFCYSPRPEGGTVCLRDALTAYYDLKTVKTDLLKLLVQNAITGTDRALGEKLLQDGVSKQNEVLMEYLSEREVADVLEDFSSFTCSVSDILSCLKALQPRYYSIASSPVKDPAIVAVCAAVLRYSLLGRPRTGVCTTYMQDRMAVGNSCPVFISHNPDFRLPVVGDTPIIMIGPGTGIAPFRAFIQERVLTKASGRNVLYFGCRHRNQDFLYKEELERWASKGVLQLRTAFSRDQAHKVYVQHLLCEDSKFLWKMISQDGAHIYVCGDAKSMAGDVHKALLQMCIDCGLSQTEAELYMEKLEKTSRYQRDVWVT